MHSCTTNCRGVQTSSTHVEEWLAVTAGFFNTAPILEATCIPGWTQVRCAGFSASTTSRVSGARCPSGWWWVRGIGSFSGEWSHGWAIRTCSWGVDFSGEPSHEGCPFGYTMLQFGSSHVLWGFQFTAISYWLWCPSQCDIRWFAIHPLLAWRCQILFASSLCQDHVTGDLSDPKTVAAFLSCADKTCGLCMFLTITPILFCSDMSYGVVMSPLWRGFHWSLHAFRFNFWLLEPIVCLFSFAFSLLTCRMYMCSSFGPRSCFGGMWLLSIHVSWSSCQIPLLFVSLRHFNWEPALRCPLDQLWRRIPILWAWSPRRWSFSWHGSLPRVKLPWIGWSINVKRWVVSITPDKRAKILDQIDSLLRSSRCDLKTLESLTGRLLWVSSLWETLRPLLGPLYQAMMTVPLTLVSISPEQWPLLLDALQDDLTLSKSLHHPSLRKNVKVVRAASFTLRDLGHARSLHFKSRRIWLGINIPGSSKRKLLQETHESLQAWKDVLVGTLFLHNMIPPTYLPLQASADACATQGEAGLGGILRLNGEVAAWFAFTISHAEAKDVFPWISDSMQKHINVWELLGQFALAFCLDRALKGRCTPISVTFACGNTSAEAAHLKALSTASGMCHVLAAFFRFQRIHNLDVSIQHIPGMWNDEADALSRGKHLPHCTPELQVDVPWTWLCSSLPEHSPSNAKFPHTLLTRWVQKSGESCLLHIDVHFGGFDPFGRCSRFYLGSQNPLSLRFVNSRLVFTNCSI